MNDLLVFTPVREMNLATVLLTIKGNVTKGNQHLIENQDDIRPLMTNDNTLTMIKALRIFRVQTGAMLQRRIDDEGYFPG